MTPHAAKTVLQTFRQSLARDKAALASAVGDGAWLVYTGDLEDTYRMFVNEAAVRAGGMNGGGLQHATRYTRLHDATAIAEQVKNGHGHRGKVCSERKGYEYSVKNLESLIEMVTRRSIKVRKVEA